MRAKSEVPEGAVSAAEGEETAYVYLLLCGDGSYYCGYTVDMERRLAAHRSGKGAKYTRARGPLRLVYLERLAGKGEALRREAAIKKLSRAAKEALLTAPCNLVKGGEDGNHL